MLKSAGLISGVLAVCALYVGTAPAYAEAYEVIPVGFFYDRGANPVRYDYSAVVMDNTTGKTYNCTVFLKPLQPLTAICNDNAKSIQSTLEPSSDLNTAGQLGVVPYPSNAAHPTALWQINSKTGDLQFCLASYIGDPNHDMPSGNQCIKVR